MNAFWNSFDTLLGLGAEPKDLTFVQISLRGIIVFLATLIMVRLGHKRSLAHKTPFDAILLVILASVLSPGSRFGSFLRHLRRRRRLGRATPGVRPPGVLFPSIWYFSQRLTGHDCAGW